MYEILIVGGGPAGLTAAIYAARAGKHVAVLERGSTGGQIISASLVENYPGIPSVSGAELARQMTEQACTFGAEIVYTEAVGLEKTSAGFRVLCMDGVREAKAVILATGASHRRLGLPGEELLTGCGVSYCALCDGAFYEGADVAAVGGGETALQDALSLSQAAEFVDKYPEGAAHPIAQLGRNVSGGQKQRLSIARALARKPEILVFDDSFSALDYRTDAALREGLAKELPDTTKVIVAQRISTIRHADQILVLDRGAAVGLGTHDELMRSCDVYREIALSQLSAAELA